APTEETRGGGGRVGAVRIGRGAHAARAVPQAALHRAEALPFESVDRVSGRMRLRHDIAGQLLAPVVVMALRARHVDLTLALLEQRTPLRDERCEARVGEVGDRLATRLARQVRGERREVAALEGEGR